MRAMTTLAMSTETQRRWIIRAAIVSSIAVALLVVTRLWSDPASVSRTVVVTPPSQGVLTVTESADRLPFADELLRAYIDAPEQVRSGISTLFVPLDSSLDAALEARFIQPSALSVPSPLTKGLLRAHATDVSITFADLVQTETYSFTTLDGRQVRIESSVADGSLFLVLDDARRIKIVATEVYAGEIVVHVLDAPISLGS